MVDEPLYDPDRHVPEDLDFTNPEVARAYIDHPVTARLFEDAGRAFRELPAADQLRELRDYLARLAEQRDQVVVLLEGDQPDADVRASLERLMVAIDRNIEGAKLRMLELD
nr:hypothetical protein [Mycobacterium sp. UM_NZ2]